MKNYNLQKGKKIILKERDKWHQFDISQIIYITCSSNICSFHTESNNIVSVYKIMKNIEYELLEYSFFRVNNSTIINLDKVEKYYKKDNIPYVLLSNDKNIKISRRRLHDFLNKLLAN